MNTKTFNVSMPESLVKKIDKQSRSNGSNRSDFIRQAVRKQLAILEQWQSVSQSVRRNYSGRRLSEKQVADIVRQSRKSARDPTQKSPKPADIHPITTKNRPELVDVTTVTPPHSKQFLARNQAKSQKKEDF